MDEIKNEENKEESAILKAYKELEANSVPREKYEKDVAALKEKNDIYLKAITEGDKVELPSDDGKTLKESILSTILSTVSLSSPSVNPTSKRKPRDIWPTVRPLISTLASKTVVKTTLIIFSPCPNNLWVLAQIYCLDKYNI